jgi:plastocyanin
VKYLLVPATVAALLVGPAAAAPPLAGQTPPPSNQVATVHIASYSFRPASVTITAGQTVLFVNDDSDAHTVTATDKSFDSGGLDSNERWRHTFSVPGTYKYICALHPYMKGTIVVTPTPIQGDDTP